MGDALDAPTEGDWGYVIRQQDLKMVRDAGFDAVRIPIRWSAHSGGNPPYAINPDFLARVDQVTGWALSLGLTTIIDVHHYDAFKGGSGAALDRLDGLWAQIAAHYADAPDALAFELINEPPGRFPSGFMDAANARLVATIRRTNPTRWIIYGADHQNSPGSLTRATPPDDPNIIATFHYYDPFPFTSRGKGVRWGTKADYTILRDDFARVAAWADRTGQAVFLGEFGVSAKVPEKDRVRWLTAVRKMAEAKGFAWCNWAFHADYDAVDKDDRWIGPVLNALTAP